MKLAQIIDNFHCGGAQVMQIIFAKAMRQYPNVDLTVISLSENTHNTPIPKQVERLGARVHYFSAQKLFDIKRFWRLAIFLRRQRFDVVHTHLTHANILGTLVGRLTGTPVVATIHNTKDDDWGRYTVFRHKIETLILRHWVDRIIAVGYSVAKVHQSRFSGRSIEVISNAQDTIPQLLPERRVQLRNSLVGNPRRPIVISTGRLVTQKGFGDLLTAFKSVCQKHPSTALLIAGDGPLRNELEFKIKELGLAKNVRLLGFCQNVSDLLAACDLFVSSSRWEGLPIGVLEAMAAGLPIVATSVGDIPRVVVEGTGLIVPPQAPARLSEALNSLLDNPAQRRSFGAAARFFIKNNHNPTDWTSKILSLYKAVRLSS